MQKPIRVALLLGQQVALISAALFLSACARTVDGIALNGNEFYIGLTRITQPRVQGNAVAYKLNNMGVAVGSGAALGWQRYEAVLVSPEKCQIIIIVRSDGSAKNAGDILSKIGGEKPCVVDFTE